MSVLSLEEYLYVVKSYSRFYLAFFWVLLAYYSTIVGLGIISDKIAKCLYCNLACSLLHSSGLYYYYSY